MVCNKAPTHQPVHYSISLNTPLSKWATVPCNTWFPYYQAQGAIYLREDEYPMIQKFTEWAKGFYNFEYKVVKVPLESYPYNCQHVGKAQWTRHPMFIEGPALKMELPPGHKVYNNLKGGIGHMRKSKAASNGPVHLRQQVTTAAWLVVKDDTSFLTACFLMRGINAVSSYWSELGGSSEHSNT